MSISQYAEVNIAQRIQVVAAVESRMRSLAMGLINPHVKDLNVIPIVVDQINRNAGEVNVAKIGTPTNQPVKANTALGLQRAVVVVVVSLV